jgi:hypothetical protein
LTAEVLLATIALGRIAAGIIGCFFAAGGVGLICFRENTADVQIEMARSLGVPRSSPAFFWSLAPSSWWPGAGSSCWR